MLLLFQFHKLVLLMGGKGVRSRQLYHKRIVMQVMGPVPLQVALTPTTPLQVALQYSPDSKILRIPSGHCGGRVPVSWFEYKRRSCSAVMTDHCGGTVPVSWFAYK